MISDTWTKSTRSGTNDGQCVEVRQLTQAAPVEVRDSKDPSGPILAFSPAAWSAFIARK
jgi:hypothetical protein